MTEPGVTGTESGLSLDDLTHNIFWGNVVSLKKLLAHLFNKLIQSKINVHRINLLQHAVYALLFQIKTFYRLMRRLICICTKKLM